MLTTLFTFIYFILLFLYVLKRNKYKFDLSSYILSIFTGSLFFSVILMTMGKGASNDPFYVPSIEPSIVYCGLITLCTIPFISHSNLKIKGISPIKNQSLLNAIAWISVVFFLLNIGFSWNELISSLSGDLGEIRSNHYIVDDSNSWLSNLPNGFKQICIICNIVFSVPWIMIYLALYNLITQKAKRTSILLLIGSLSGLTGNILVGGRSGFIFWILSFGAVFILLRPFMQVRHIALLKKIMSILLFCFIAYIAIVTISRFGDSDSGTKGSIFEYAGQPFINFCYFYDTFKCPLPSLQIVFPFSYYLIGWPIQSSGELQETLSILSNEQLGLFYTFIGHIATTSFNFVAIIFCFLYALVSNILLKNLLVQKGNLKSCYVLLASGSVMFLGLFGHYYSDWSRTLCVIIFFFLILKIK